MQDLILVVEGYAENVLQIRRELRAARIPNRCHFCGSGGEALAYLKGEGEYADREAFPSPRLMVLGMKQPGGDGLGVLGWLRSKQEFQDMGVIVTAESAGPRSLDRAYELGADSIVMRSLEAPNGVGLISTIAGHLKCPVEPSGERDGEAEPIRVNLLGRADISCGTPPCPTREDFSSRGGFGMHRSS